MIDVAKMIERQRVLAKFGEFALRSSDLQAVLDEACVLVGQALDTELSQILEIQPDAKSLLVRAGVGWRPGIVGETRLRMDERSSETFAIQSAEPLIMPDISKETRFVLTPFLIEHGVISLVNVPIFVAKGEPAYGLLQVDNRYAREFDEHDIEFLRCYAAILGPVIDRLHKRRDLEIALEDNKRLLAEVQHRVKNHIGVITSLIYMRARRTQSAEARAELQVVGDRVETLRLAHDHVYAGGNSEAMALGPYARKILEHLRDLHGDHVGPITLDVSLDDIEIRANDAVPLGLIINEFVTNSFKYAFGPGGGVIGLRAERLPDRRIHVRVWDDGCGLPSAPSAPLPGSGTGIKLIDGLARQLRAEARWTSLKGTELDLVFNDRSAGRVRWG